MHPVPELGGLLNPERFTPFKEGEAYQFGHEHFLRELCLHTQASASLSRRAKQFGRLVSVESRMEKSTEALSTRGPHILHLLH